MSFPRGLLAGLLVLAACSTPVTTVPPPTTPPVVLPSGTATPSTVPPATPSAVRPMPASDGGPMLWPVATTVTLEEHGWRTEGTRYGFMDVTGTMVVKPRYESYEYCRDASGRVAFVVARATQRPADVLDLTGALLARAKTEWASCGPVGEVIFSLVIDAEAGNVRDGLIDVASGNVLLPLKAGRHVEVVDDHTVNVTESTGEYFLDPGSGRRTPHPGWVTDAALEKGAPGLPAGAKPASQDGLHGYLDLNGAWILAPDLVDGSRFENGYALVQLAADRFTFLDAALKQVGGVWTSVDTVYQESGEDWRTIGYAVSGAHGQALLGPDLRPIVPAGPARITCDWPARGACSVVGTDGRASLVRLPEGTITAMPDGFRQAISGSFVADRVGSNDAMGKVLALDSGTVTRLDAPSFCTPEADDWVTCTPTESEVLPPVVLDAQGNRTPFASVQAVYDPVPGAGVVYYWATTGRYQGFIDAHGTWLYRHGRFTDLED